MKFRLLTGCVLVAGMIAIGCNPERGKTPVASKTTASKDVEPKAEGGIAEGGIDFENFEVNLPDSFDGDFNPDGMEVGAKVGNLAPEIDGVDLDGNAFKLSDYRGKVVMLDFYGDW